MDINFVRSEHLSIRDHPILNEKWVQNIVRNDPSILGLGDLVLIQEERHQPRAGRLDLLLRNPDTMQRYEVELQLGATDGDHIIRTMEYWDNEKKRYPQYEHCAVLIAEDITSRFLNVISLFNGAIPLIAIQMQLLKIGNDHTLVFAKIMDEISLGPVDEDEDAQSAPADRNFWEDKSTKKTVELADKVLEIFYEFDKTLKLNFTKVYIGIEKDGRPFNFSTFSPKKKHLRLGLKLNQSSDIDAEIENSGIEALEYRRGWYQFRLNESDLADNRELLRKLAESAYRQRVGV